MHKRYICPIFIIILLLISCGPAFSYWIWTPESGQWENPKTAPKDTPTEQLSHAISFYKQKDYKSAVSEFKKVIKYYPLSKEAPSAQYYIGRIMEDTGNPYEAFKAYQKVIDLYTYTELVDDVIERQFNIGKLFFSGEKLKLLGPIKVPAKDKAIEILKAVSENAPYGKYAEEAIFDTGLTYKSIADYESAIMVFKKLIDKYPSSKFIDQSRYELAECSKLLSLNPDYDQTPTITARKEFEDFIVKHPDSGLTSQAKDIVDKLKNKEAENSYNIAKFYESRRMKDSAIVYYKEIIKNYPDTKWEKLSQERLKELEK